MKLITNQKKKMTLPYNMTPRKKRNPGGVQYTQLTTTKNLLPSLSQRFGSDIFILMLYTSMLQELIDGTVLSTKTVIFAISEGIFSYKH